MPTGPPTAGETDGADPVDPARALGRALARAREESGRSLEHVAAATRIRGSLIAAMERGDFAPCGGHVYARGHLRSIAAAVGADPRPLVSGYDDLGGSHPPSALPLANDTPLTGPAGIFATNEPTTPTNSARVRPPGRADQPHSAPHPVRTVSVRSQTVPASPLRPQPLRPQPLRGEPLAITVPRGARDQRGGSGWLLAGVAVAVLAVIAAALGLLAGRGGGPSTITGRAPAAASAHQTSPVRSAPQSPAASPRQTVALAGVNVTVRVHDDPSWVHVVDQTGAVVFQGVLSPGASKPFHATTSLAFVFGYAPAIDLVVAGQDYGAPSSTGTDVVSTTVDAATLAQGNLG